jgi:hypothetical protein
VFPVIGHAQGQITYQGVVTYKNHTTENIPATTTSDNLITFGPPDQVAMTVTPDPVLIDFSKIKLIQLNFEYADAKNNIDIHQEVVVKSGTVTPANWTFYAKDPTKTSYSYTATYYMATTPPSVFKQPSVSSSDTDLVLMMPAQASGA